MTAYKARLVSLVVTLIATGAAGAQSEDAGQRKQGAHVHGIAHMSIAAEGSRILVELTSPAANLIGFERAPRTDDERATLALAKENLMAGDAMIRFNTEAACRLETAEIDTAFAEADHGDSHGHTQDPTHLHGADEDAHADFAVTYSFECDRPSELGSAALGLFAGFPALERVLVQYVTDEGQGGAELTPRQPVMSFVPL
jgi:hypothetical protein